MTARVDERLQQVADHPIHSEGPGGDRGRPPPGSNTVSTVEYYYDTSTNNWTPVVAAFDSALPSPPHLPTPGEEGFNGKVGEPITVGSQDESLDYRVIIERNPDATYGAVASPLTEVQHTARELMITVLAAGGLVVLVGGVGCWWVIRRGLRPVDGMIDTAAAIAAGDLSQRVEHPEDGTELGRLGRALDEMLGQLEADAQERERAQIRLRQFVGDASHELRTPVAAIRGYAELYREGGIKPGESLERAMGRIDSESIRMGRLVDDLLLLTRLDQQRPLRHELVDLAPLVRDSAATFEVIDRNRPLKVGVLDSCMVDGDDVRLRQVIDNLVGNAFTHTPAGTPVRVSLSRDGEEVVLVVADDGPGIPAQDLPRVFERFHRVDASRARATGGAGLGL